MLTVPRKIVPNDPVYLGPHSKNGQGLVLAGQRNVAPTSGTYTGTDRVYYTPFYISKPYLLARWWWLLGATVGTDYVEMGIYDQDFNLFKASPRTLHAGTANTIQHVNPGIHAAQITSGTDDTDATSYTTASVTLKAGVMYLLSVENSKASAADAVSSITGGGTWTSRSTTTFNTSTANRVSIWSCVPTADYTGTLSISFGANTQTGAVWSLNAFYHVDTATNDGIVQNATNTGNSTTPSATLSAFGSANNATFGAFGTLGGTGTRESASYIELSDNAATTPAQSLQTMFRPDNDTSVTETITSAQWGACAVEIKSLGTGTVYLPPMRGWFAIHCSGTTATFFKSGSAVYLPPNAYIQSSAATGLPAIATPASSSGAAFIHVMGITSRATP